MKSLFILCSYFLTSNLIGQENPGVMGLPLTNSTRMQEAAEAGHSNTPVKITDVINGRELGSCPKNLEDWKTWRRGKFMELVSGQQLSLLKVGKDGAVELNHKSVVSFLERCKPGQEEIHALPEFQACFERMVQLEKIATLFLEEGLSGGKEEAVQSVEGFPDTYSSVNLKAVAALATQDSEELTKAIKALTAGSKEAKAIRFDSAIIAGLKSLVILDVRDGKQFWTHFTLGSTDGFLSLEVDPEKDSKKGTATYQFHSIKPNAGLLRKKVDPRACVQCHRTSPISLVAKDSKGIEVILSDGKKDGLTIMTEMNKHTADVALSLPKGFQIEALGPARGPVKKRPLEYLRRLVSRTSTPAADDAALTRVAPYMKCATCHEGNVIAQTIGHQIIFPDIFENYITTGHMPPKNKLSPPDRKLLSELVSAEYFGGFPTDDSKAKDPGVFGAWLNEPCPWTK